MSPSRRCRRGCRRGTLFVASVAIMAGLAAATTGLDKDRAPLEERFGPARSPPSAEVYPSSSSSSSSSRRTAVRRGRSRGRDRWRDLEIAGDLSFTSPRVEVYGLHDDEQHPSEHETEHAIWSEEEHGPPVEEPLSMAHIDPRNIQRCSRWDAGDITGGGATCGPPLSAPCFDRSRCRQLSVYVYDQECSLADSRHILSKAHQFDDEQHQSSYWREAAWRAGILAETYEEACLFIHVNTHNHDEPCATRSPLWNGGVNHIMMEFTPWWSYVKGRPRISDSFAMDWAFDHHTCFYRSGYDFSLPLRPKVLFPKFASTPATNRRFFLTFKGAVYLDGFGVEERTVVSRLHDERSGIVSVVRCFELHGEHLRPENIDYCSQARVKYSAYYYEDLMNTTFALVPAGRSPGTFRLGEVMSAGAIPVFVVRDWVRPLEEKIDWPSFSFVFSPDDVGPGMVDALRAVGPDQLLEMQRKSLEAYWELFGGSTNYSVIAETTVKEIISRVTFH